MNLELIFTWDFYKFPPKKDMKIQTYPKANKQSSALLILNFTVTMQTATHISNEWEDKEELLLTNRKSTCPDSIYLIKAKKITIHSFIPLLTSYHDESLPNSRNRSYLL